MKKILLMAILLCLLVSCQPKAANEDHYEKPQVADANIKTENKPDQLSISYSPTPSAISTAEVNLRIGNIEHWSELCLMIQNPDLNAGDKIQIITARPPQQIFQAEIKEKNGCKKGDGESELQTLNTTEYRLSSPEEVPVGIGIGIVNPLNKAKLINGIVSMDIDNDKKEEYFRQCAGNESVLLAVWKGKPLVGKRIWYSMYRLNYDVEPSCKNKDYEGMPDE